MSKFSNYLEDQITNWLNGAAFAPQLTGGVFVQLYSQDPGETGSLTGALFTRINVAAGGTSGFMNTSLNENTVLTLNNEHISFYSRTNIIGLFCDIGLASSGGFGGTNIYPNYSNAFYPRVNNVNSGYAVSLNTQGFFIANRTNSTEVYGFKNSTKYIITNTSVAKINLDFNLFCENSDLGRTNHSPRQCAFASIGEGLTDTQANNFYTAVQAFQTTLGRNV